MDWIIGFAFFLVLGIIIFIMEFFRNKLNLPPEITRKSVHLITGLFIAITPLFLKSNTPVLAIALLVIPLNYYAIQKDVLKSIHNTTRKSYGTVFYPMAFFILVLLLWDNHKTVLIASTLVLAIADTAAAMIGVRIKKPLNYVFGEEKKSVQGSVSMFVISTLIIFFTLHFVGRYDDLHIETGNALLFSLVTALIATACESVSFIGSDNLTVPLGTAFSLHFLLTHPNNQAFYLGVVLALILAIVSYRVKFLDGGGSVTMFMLGIIVFGTGGWKFSLPILSFFLLSSIISKLGKSKKQKFMDTFQKSSQRDLWQVLANGGIAGILVLIWNYFPYEIFYYMFSGAIAAANADTWATEIGVFSKSRPRHILTFTHVPIGSSGGVSLLGTFGALIGSAVIAAVSYLFIKNIYIFVFITLAGFIGSVADSIIGGTIQVQYKCPNCSKITEKTIHCITHKTDIVSGLEWIDNDIVNTLCTFFGAIFAGFILYFSL